MLLGRIKELLYKYQIWLTYVGALIAFNLMLNLAYDEIVVNHENPVKLIVSIVVLGVAIFASYIGRRRHMLSYFILESSDDINMYALDLNYRFMSINRNDIRLMQEIFNFTPKVGDMPLRHLDAERSAELKANVDRALKGETFTSLDTIEYDGKTLYWQNMFSPIYNRRKKIIGAFSIVVDVTEQRKQELAMQKMAYEDVLTQVHNRRYIELAFDECVLNKTEEITVIMSDLNKFKEANDTYGHARGDQILIEYGELLTKVMPENAVVARLGGDEFAVLLPGVSMRQADFLINLVKIEMMVKDMPVTASLGSYTDSYEAHKTFVDFCACADERMYRDKNQKG
ncbi:diguanylate cyclase [Streptococcus equinus JB1]|uniref:Diguanylate cyclase n=1 Tax=Streptococcus equinus JB1 TaxID=1294274 RepID=A0A091BWY3_STREI|nr:sensor domain-containing diguanylate cyclase [Streptococcus equinus]KFN88950.1 diguanylate cyclase [Streptococcus equinus JB1]SFL26125.1 diguanylate cyclase (GGDEF) domain-containing protein [Streptococcus equinus JB1]